MTHTTSILPLLAEEVLLGKIMKFNTNDINTIHSLIPLLCRKLYESSKTVDSYEWHKMVDRYFAFIQNNFSAELAVLAAQTALVTYNLPIHTTKLKNFERFSEKYGKYIKAAID